MHTGDTIVAISSATGVAPRMIVRLSGPRAYPIAASFISPAERVAQVTRSSINLDGSPLPAWLYSFLAPHSYTGEDSLELHLPGNPAIAARVMAICVKHGARLAEPGEFTARAFFNGRLDLTQAEGVGAVIAAHGEADLQAGRRLLAGELSSRIKPLLDQLTDLLALVELAIDFAEEDVDFASPGILAGRLERIQHDLVTVIESGQQLRPIVRQPLIVLYGRPNAGKSTLLNALVGHERAVVSATAGTTRDVLSTIVSLPRGDVQLFDVAGIDLPPAASEIERKMHDRALAAAREADFAVLVKDVRDMQAPPHVDRAPDLTAFTKADTLSDPLPAVPPAERSILVSARTGQGMNDLRQALDAIAFGSTAPSAKLALTARHFDALASAREAIDRADPAAPFELLADDLRDAIDALGSIVGVVAPDDVLAKIFSGFCIGK